jgi:hypothetical protein
MAGEISAEMIIMPWPKGKQRSEDERLRISKGLSGIKRSEEWKQRASLRMKAEIAKGYQMPSQQGRMKSEESKWKQSVTRKTRMASGEIKSVKGWKWSDESRKKLSVAQSGMKKFRTSMHTYNCVVALVKALQKNDEKKATGGGEKLWCYFVRKNVTFSMRSMWEVRVAQWLDEQEMDWEYEGVNNIIEIPYGLYVPDFTLTGTNVLVEVKGKLWGARQLMKINWCAANGYDVRVVDEKNISNINLNTSWMQRQNEQQDAVRVDEESA